MIEVEQKFRVEDLDSVRADLSTAGANLVGVERHCDTYFRHPVRDFRETDEAFRIRSVNERAVLTYKGPRNDSPVKMRREIEVDFDGKSIQQMTDMLTALGFISVTEVSKQREVYDYRFTDQQFTVALDEAKDIGEFVELELIATDDEAAEIAAGQIEQCAEHLGLSQVEPRSYLVMLLENRNFQK